MPFSILQRIERDETAQKVAKYVHTMHNRKEHPKQLKADADLPRYMMRIKLLLICKIAKMGLYGQLHHRRGLIGIILRKHVIFHTFGDLEVVRSQVVEVKGSLAYPVLHP